MGRVVQVTEFPGIDLRADRVTAELGRAVEVTDCWRRDGVIGSRPAFTESAAITGVGTGVCLDAAWFPQGSSSGTIGLFTDSAAPTVPKLGVDQAINGGALSLLHSMPASFSGEMSAAVHGSPTKSIIALGFDACGAGVAAGPKEYNIGAATCADMTLTGCPAGGQIVGRFNLDNRLLVANFTAATASANGSTVWFSNPNDPNTFSTNAYINCGNGDGERITSIVDWGDLTFIFKESRCWIVYGTGADANGLLEVNYRVVALGATIHAGQYSPASGYPNAVACNEGVIVPSQRGWLISRGGNFQPIWPHLRPLCGSLESNTAIKRRVAIQPSWNSSRVVYADGIQVMRKIVHQDGVIFARVSDSGGSGANLYVVIDVLTGWASLWNIPGSTLTALFAGGGFIGLARQQSGSNYWASMRPNEASIGANTETLGGGASAINGFYAFGGSSLGQPGSQKTLRRTCLRGSGRASGGGNAVLYHKNDEDTGFTAHSSPGTFGTLGDDTPIECYYNDAIRGRSVGLAIGFIGVIHDMTLWVQDEIDPAAIAP